MRIARPLLAAAVAVAALAGTPASAETVCVTRPSIGGACVTVRPDDPDPIDVRCGGTFWTCATIV